MTVDSPPIQLIVGLGNPGPDYERTRHNAGFWFVDELAVRHGGGFRPVAKFHGESCQVRLDGQDCRLLKPMTFMNHSGQSIAALAHFYKIQPDAILVIHDDLDLAAGIVRLKRGGGHSGHNGLRDTIRHIGKNFARLRLGIGHPGHKDRVVEYVLHSPSRDEDAAIRTALEAAADRTPELAAGAWDKTVRELHGRS